MEPDESSSNTIDGADSAGPAAGTRAQQQHAGIRTKSRMRVLHGSSTSGSRIALVPSYHQKLLPGWSQLQAYTHTGRGRQAMGWIVTLAVTIFGGLLRFIRLGSPKGLVFDETYYVKDAWTMLMTGEARDWPKTIHGTAVNALFAAGQTDNWLPQAENVVHPPLGKWFIALGLKLFGGAGNIAAWRVATAAAGTIGILLMCRIALKLFRNLPLAALAGILMSIDGLGIVMSRTGILDIFIMSLVLGAFLCLLNHREWALAKLTAYADAHHVSPQTPQNSRNLAGPSVFFSWWRLAAAVLLGLSCGIKWSGIYFFAVFALISVLWDAYNRHTLGYRFWFASAVVHDGLPAALYMVPTATLSYCATWAGWFIHPDSYMHNWAAAHPGEGITWLPETLRSFVEYHRQMWQFHVNLSEPHPYMANAWMWPLQIRPTNFWLSESAKGIGLCAIYPGSPCYSNVLALGNPLLWWIGTLCALLVIIITVVDFANRRGDWRVWAVLAGWLGGWLPWLQYLNRTTFNFYAIVLLPWVILSVIYMASWLKAQLKKRAYHAIVGISVAAIVLTSVFFFPLWTGIPLPRGLWAAHMWLHSWI